MKVAISMVFAKATKRTTVFATDDGLAPVESIYVNTASMRSHGISGEGIILIISNAPLLPDADADVEMQVKLRLSRTTKRKTLFEAVDVNAPVSRLYIDSEWLRSHDFGDVLYLAISDAASGDGSEADAPGGSSAEAVDASDAFNAFLDSVVVRREGSWLATEHIRTAWAALQGANPEDDVIAGIHKNSIAGRFRARFSAPPGSRGRVGGRVQYRWEGYGIRGNDEA